MRKIQGYKGKLYLILGIALFALAGIFDWPGENYLCGLAAGLIGAGGGITLRQMYWRLPKTAKNTPKSNMNIRST